MQRLWPLAVIAVAFAIFGFLYASATPYRTGGFLMYQKDETGNPRHADDIGAPDERQHVNYVVHIMEGKGLMVLDPADPQLYENYQAHQPPLYYALAAGWCKVFSSPDSLKNSSGGMGIRMFSILIGLGTIAGLYFIGLWASGKEQIGFACAAFSLLPMFVALNSAASNDPLLMLVCTWAIAFMVKCMQQGWTLKDSILVGVFAGLAILTKTTGVFLLPLALAAAILSKGGDWKKWIVPCGIGGLLALPWWIRNFSLYQDPLAQNVFLKAFVGAAKAEQFSSLGLRYWTDMVGWWTVRSFTGAFGYMDVYLFEASGKDVSNNFYLGFAILFAILLISGAYAFTQKPAENEMSVEKPAILFGVAILLVTGLFVMFNRIYFQGQARYLYPAIGAYAVLFGAGIHYIAGAKLKHSWLIPFVLLAAVNIFAYMQLGPAFQMRTGLQ